MTSPHEGPEADNVDLYTQLLLLATTMEAGTAWSLTPRMSQELRQPYDIARHLAGPDRSAASFHMPRQIWEGRLPISGQRAVGISSQKRHDGTKHG